MSIGKEPIWAFLSLELNVCNILSKIPLKAIFVLRGAPRDYSTVRSQRTPILHFCFWRAPIENAAIMTQSNCKPESRNHYEGQDGFCNVLDKFFYICMLKGIFFAEVRNRMRRKVGLKSFSPISIKVFSPWVNNGKLLQADCAASFIKPLKYFTGYRTEMWISKILSQKIVFNCHNWKRDLIEPMCESWVGAWQKLRGEIRRRGDI